MKKKIFIFVAIVCLIVLAGLFIRPAIIFIAKKQLSAVFKDSEVSIGSCRLEFTRRLSLFDVRIKKNPAYDFLVKEVTLEYSLASIVRARILKVSLRDSMVSINLPRENIAEFSGYLKTGSKSLVVVKSLELSKSKLDVKTKDLNLSAALSLQVDPISQIIDRLDIVADTLGLQGLQVSNLSLQAGQGWANGQFKVSRVKYNKLIISGIKSQAVLFGKELLLKDISAKVFDGAASGELKAALDSAMSYSGVLKLTGLDVARFIEDFELQEKFEMTGRLSGVLNVGGKGAKIEVLSGNLTSLDPGGVLVIKDESFLKNMAQKTGQSTEILVESFKNYQYTIGATRVSLDNRDVVLDTQLEGKAGKRKLRTVLHDLTLQKEKK